MSTKHEGLRAWFELLRTSREGLMPKYWVRDPYNSVHCSNQKCKCLTIAVLGTRSWAQRRVDGSIYLHSFRHHGSCPWRECVDIDSQNGFTVQPLERAYVYWAQLEHKLNHK